MKKICSLLLVIVMICSTFAGLQITSTAADLPSSGSCGENVTYTYTNTNNIGVLTISGSGAMYDNQYIQYGIFYNQTSIKYVIIKSGVTRIGDFTFYGCSGLISITIPDSVTSIGLEAFHDCSSLKNISIPNTVTNLDHGVFFGCSGLTSITISNSVTSINNSTFYNCSGLTSITIPNSVTSIGGRAFYGCSNLTSIAIPEPVTSIGDGAFEGCTGLTRVDICSIESWCKIAFYTKFSNPLYYAHNLYLNDELITDLVIPDSVTGIGKYAFYGCSELASVTVPTSVTSIGNYAFSKCNGLIKVDIDTLEAWCSIYFSNVDSNPLVYAHNLYLDKQLITDLVIPDSVKGGIGNYSFYGCSGLTSIFIPNSVTSIGNSAFYNCNGLTSITILDSVTSIGNSAFYNCSGVKELTIPCSANIYNSSATFYNCTNIEKVTLTKGNGIMQNYGTSTSSNASKTYYQYTPWYISKDNFNELIIKDGVKSIGSFAFSSCSELTSVTIPNSVTSIGQAAFESCNRLGSVIIGSSVNSVDSDSFSGCTGIKNTYLYSKQLDSTQNLASSLPAGSKLYAYASTDAQLYCSIYGVNFIALEEPRCDEGIHTFVETIITEPTCVNEGLKKCSCRFCDVTKDEIIPALNHNYTEEIIAPTCTANGYTKHTCSRCGDTYNDTETDMIAHTVVTDTAVEPTCRATGLTEGSHCSVCGTVLTAQTVIPLTNHRYETTNIASTCVQKGFTLHTCVWCGDAFKSDYSDTGEHSYVETITTPASCSKEGVKTFTCSICGDSYTRSIAMTEHTPVVDKAVAPTCEKAGLAEGSHCSVCGYIISEQAVVPANGHSYEQSVTEPTCKDKGYTIHTCTVCGDSYVDSYTQTTQEHDYRATITTPASCSKQGVKTFTCSVCGDKYTEAIAMTEHTPTTDKAVAPTCTKAGLTAGSHCSVCGYVIVEQAVVSAKSHSYTASVTKDSSCSQVGVKTYTCTVCGDKYIEAIPLKTHTIVSDNAVEPTCTKYGLSAGKYCSVCGKIFETQEEIEPLGHDFGSVVIPATLTANGVITHPCSRCEKADASEVIYAPKTFALAKTSYVYSGKAIAPAVTGKDSKGKALVKGTDYDVIYKNNINIGTASVVITFKGNYKGTKSLAFAIIPKATNIALAGAKKAFTAKWTKIAGVTGYQIQYSTNSKFTGAKTVTVKSNKTLKTTVKKLSAKKVYYVHIRTYKTISKVNYFSTWSKTYKVKTQ